MTRLGVKGSTVLSVRKGCTHHVMCPVLQLFSVVLHKATGLRIAKALWVFSIVEHDKRQHDSPSHPSFRGCSGHGSA